MRLLVTGGAGYIGAHLVVELLDAGHEVVVVDDLSRGHAEALLRAQTLAGRTCAFHRGDIGDAELMAKALVGVDVVLHLAAFKKVGESMEAPERYLTNNVGGTASMLAAMQDAGVTRIVYSSSASVYGQQELMPIREDVALEPESAYGYSKLQGERMIEWMVRCRDWSAVSLRYFNPVGAHASGEIGEPFEDAGTLVPRALMALTQEGARLSIFGTDYPTPDGTCLRDYIHIEDLCRAHLLAIEALDKPGHSAFNVGTGQPYSVREVLAACARVTGRDVPADEGPRRAGDPPISQADPSRFREALGFEARHGLDEMVASAWRWLSSNPRGYRA